MGTQVSQKFKRAVEAEVRRLMEAGESRSLGMAIRDLEQAKQSLIAVQKPAKASGLPEVFSEARFALQQTVLAIDRLKRAISKL